MPLKIVGLDVFRAGYVQPGLIPSRPIASTRCARMRCSSVPRRNVRSASRWATRFASGSRSRDVALRVAGEIGSAGNQRLAVMDIAGAQAAFDRVGLLSRIDLRLRPGVDAAAFVERLRAILPPGSPSSVRRRRSRQAPACRVRTV